MHPLLFRAVASLGQVGLIASAIGAATALNNAATHSLGPDHPATLASRNNLAHWRGEAGDLAGAVAASLNLASGGPTRAI